MGILLFATRNGVPVETVMIVLVPTFSLIFFPELTIPTDTSRLALVASGWPSRLQTRAADASVDRHCKVREFKFQFRSC